MEGKIKGKIEFPEVIDVDEIDSDKSKDSPVKVCALKEVKGERGDSVKKGHKAYSDIGPCENKVKGDFSELKDANAAGKGEENDLEVDNGDVNRSLGKGAIIDRDNDADHLGGGVCFSDDNCDKAVKSSEIPGDGVTYVEVSSDDSVVIYDNIDKISKVDNSGKDSLSMVDVAKSYKLMKCSVVVEKLKLDSDPSKYTVYLNEGSQKRFVDTVRETFTGGNRRGTQNNDKNIKSTSKESNIKAKTDVKPDVDLNGVDDGDIGRHTVRLDMEPGTFVKAGKVDILVANDDDIVDEIKEHDLMYLEENSEIERNVNKDNGSNDYDYKGETAGSASGAKRRHEGIMSDEVFQRKRVKVVDDSDKDVVLMEDFQVCQKIYHISDKVKVFRLAIQKETVQSGAVDEEVENEKGQSDHEHVHGSDDKSETAGENTASDEEANSMVCDYSNESDVQIGASKSSSEDDAELKDGTVKVEVQKSESIGVSLRPRSKIKKKSDEEVDYFSETYDNYDSTKKASGKPVRTIDPKVIIQERQAMVDHHFSVSKHRKQIVARNLVSLLNSLKAKFAQNKHAVGIQFEPICVRMFCTVFDFAEFLKMWLDGNSSMDDNTANNLFDRLKVDLLKVLKDAEIQHKGTDDWEKFQVFITEEALLVLRVVLAVLEGIFNGFQLVKAKKHGAEVVKFVIHGQILSFVNWDDESKQLTDFVIEKLKFIQDWRDRQKRKTFEAYDMVAYKEQMRLIENNRKEKELNLHREREREKKKEKEQQHILLIPVENKTQENMTLVNVKHKKGMDPVLYENQKRIMENSKKRLNESKEELRFIEIKRKEVELGHHKDKDEQMRLIEMNRGRIELEMNQWNDIEDQIQGHEVSKGKWPSLQNYHEKQSTVTVMGSGIKTVEHKGSGIKTVEHNQHLDEQTKEQRSQTQEKVLQAIKKRVQKLNVIKDTKEGERKKRMYKRRTQPSLDGLGGTEHEDRQSSILQPQIVPFVAAVDETVDYVEIKQEQVNDTAEYEGNAMESVKRSGLEDIGMQSTVNTAQQAATVADIELGVLNSAETRLVIAQVQQTSDTTSAPEFKVMMYVRFSDPTNPQRAFRMVVPLPRDNRVMENQPSSELSAQMPGPTGIQSAQAPGIKVTMMVPGLNSAGNAQVPGNVMTTTIPVLTQVGRALDAASPVVTSLNQEIQVRTRLPYSIAQSSPQMRYVTQQSPVVQKASMLNPNVVFPLMVSPVPIKDAINTSIPPHTQMLSVASQHMQHAPMPAVQIPGSNVQTKPMSSSPAVPVIPAVNFNRYLDQSMKRVLAGDNDNSKFTMKMQENQSTIPPQKTFVVKKVPAAGTSTAADSNGDMYEKIHQFASADNEILENVNKEEIIARLRGLLHHDFVGFYNSDIIPGYVLRSLDNLPELSFSNREIYDLARHLLKDLKSRAEKEFTSVSSMGAFNNLIPEERNKALLKHKKKLEAEGEFLSALIRKVTGLNALKDLMLPIELHMLKSMKEKYLEDKCEKEEAGELQPKIVNTYSLAPLSKGMKNDNTFVENAVVTGDNMKDFVQIKLVSANTNLKSSGEISKKVMMYVCRVCSWVYADKPSFLCHFKERHMCEEKIAVPDIELFRQFITAFCGLCGIRDPYHFKIHYNDKETKSSVRSTCSCEPLMFYSTWQFRNHMQYHRYGEAGAPFKCNRCMQYFWFKSTFKMHLLITPLSCGRTMIKDHDENLESGSLKGEKQTGVELLRKQLKVWGRKKKKLEEMKQKIACAIAKRKNERSTGDNSLIGSE
ncbi:uncharacterized protein LOC128205630 isoform X1 [Mya arenaria]|uniref:uncharacterized protein LOC128205630 isoform X1 n=1 Tax=Mya arenaria TaxID=6604 RepID=UPI0022E4C907|nr:uncharacterized protein LOC128205630 isoform X1 [Mya arenaria]